MAGTVTTLEQKAGGLRKVQFTWLSDTAGAASATTPLSYNAMLLRAIFKPDAGGTAPTAAYDVTVNDSDGYDLLNGTGADLSATAVSQKTGNDGLCPVASSPLSLAVSNAGEGKGGVVTLYLLPIDIPG
jgi:hypothetical protein